MKCRIFNNDCMLVMDKMLEYNQKVDIVLTSPPYNTGRPSTSERSRENMEGRYDVHLDTLSQNDYCQWVVDIFNKIDSVLEKNGCVLWNVSYGSDASVNTESIGLMWLSIADIIRNTNFTVADRIIWKKNSALPNNVSPNKLTRIVEDVFVFVRKDEYKTFTANKKVSSTSKTGQKYYENVFNFIEAKNNDGSCKLNKATFSSDLVSQLLDIYAKDGMTVFDPFNGTGTTGVACIEHNCNYYGAEISEAQCEYSKERLQNLTDETVDIFKIS